MKTFDMYHRSHNVRADDDAIDPTAPEAIQDFVAIGLRQKPPNLRSKEMRLNIIAADPGLSFGDVSKCLGELWRGLPDAEKARYNRTCVPA